MSSFRLLDRRTGILAVAFALLLTAIVPVFASAAQVTTRSIELSSSAADADAVTYTINFTPETAGAGAFIVDFCTNTPLIGEDCTPPSGFSVSGATGTNVSDLAANTLLVDSALTADTPFSVVVSNVNNPTAAGPLYARIVSYVDDSTATTTYEDTDPGTHIDDGSVALSITNTIGVSAAVLESLTFCASGAALVDGDATYDGSVADNNYCESATAPTVALGHDVGSGVVALSSDALDTGTVYTQLSTNAAGGAVVRLKSNVICGGLLRSGDTTQTAADPCTGIAPAGATGTFTAGTAKFGLKVAIADLGSSPSTNKLVANTNYNSSDYRLNWVANNATGVSSTYGDELLNTGNAPVSDQGAQVTFGASINNNTPAGRYSADLSMIATGKF